jgi:hypothetical protein
MSSPPAKKRAPQTPVEEGGGALRGCSFVGPASGQQHVLWSDAKALVAECNRAFGEEYEFALIHRAEGGVMCLRGPGFVSDEGKDGAVVPTDAPRRTKSFRFAHPHGADWPSSNNRFTATDNHALAFFAQGSPFGPTKKVSIEGVWSNCPGWTRSEMNLFCSCVARVFRWQVVHSPGAKQVRALLADTAP